MEIRKYSAQGSSLAVECVSLFTQKLGHHYNAFSDNFAVLHL